jgi:hypothetical protein
MGENGRGALIVCCSRLARRPAVFIADFQEMLDKVSHA